MKVGILALQGCVDPHISHLQSLGAQTRLVKLPEHLPGLDGLILPGGESTTMIKLARAYGLWEALQNPRIPYWGICAGSILMAREVENPVQESLDVMDIAVRRNAYGRQLDSFEGTVDLEDRTEPAVFIRAPRFLSWGAEVQVKGKVNGEEAFLDDGFHMVTAFHPELTGSPWFHRIFLERLSQNRPLARGPRPLPRV